MRKGLLLWIMVLGSLLQLGAATRNKANDGKVIYVKEGSNGNGNSWATAMGDLQAALKKAKSGQEIWVAAGVYVPTYDGNRSIAFSLVNGVSMYGGFAGFENDPSERNVEVNKTILSGEIGTASKDDNSYTVVYAEKITAATTIDGFVIADGNANGLDNSPTPNACGAAWFNRNASPTIQNCVFQENEARRGAAIYNFAGENGSCSPIIKDCTFADNKADMDGGAMFNNGDKGKCMPVITNCFFRNNIATYGAGMMNQASNGITKVIVKQCTFTNNKSLVKGSAIYNHRDNTGLCTAETIDCKFEDNLASVGGDINNTLNNGIGGGGN